MEQDDIKNLILETVKKNLSLHLDVETKYVQGTTCKELTVSIYLDNEIVDSQSTLFDFDRYE